MARKLGFILSMFLAPFIAFGAFGVGKMAVGEVTERGVRFNDFIEVLTPSSELANGMLLAGCSLAVLAGVTMLLVAPMKRFVGWDGRSLCALDSHAWVYDREVPMGETRYTFYKCKREGCDATKQSSRFE